MVIEFRLFLLKLDMHIQRDLKPLRQNSETRARHNRYLNSGLGILRRVSQMMAGAPLTDADKGFSQEDLNKRAQDSCRLLNAALQGKLLREPALWLRRASLMQLDSTLPEHAKLHAAERAVRMLELGVESAKPPAIDFHHPIHINAMVGLAIRCESQDRRDLTIRFLDIVDLLDPDNEQYADSRLDMRDRCQPVSIRPYIAPARPDAISPSALPPAIGVELR